MINFELTIAHLRIHFGAFEVLQLAFDLRRGGLADGHATQIELIDARFGLVGRGIMKTGVHAGLMKRERAKFLKEEWPALRARLERLEVDLRMLFSA